MTYDINSCRFSGTITHIKPIQTRSGIAMTSFKIRCWKEPVRCVAFRELANQLVDEFETGAITDMVSNVFIIWRNKVKERLIENCDPKKAGKLKEKPDTRLSCVKQRETGEEPSYALWFHPQSCQFLGGESCDPKQYIKKGETKWIDQN